MSHDQVSRIKTRKLSRRGPLERLEQPHLQVSMRTAGSLLRDLAGEPSSARANLDCVDRISATVQGHPVDIDRLGQQLLTGADCDGVGERVGAKYIQRRLATQSKATALPDGECLVTFVVSEPTPVAIYDRPGTGSHFAVS